MAALHTKVQIALHVPMQQARKAAGPGELPWEQPCKYELQVALNGLMAGVPTVTKGSGASVMFLLDGSGSVTEGTVIVVCIADRLSSASYHGRLISDKCRLHQQVHAKSMFIRTSNAVADLFLVMWLQTTSAR